MSNDREPMQSDAARGNWTALLKNYVIGSVALIGALATVLGGLYAVHSYIDARIRSNIEDPAFIRQLSRSLRPSVIFDERGSILTDLGAMRYLRDIQVQPQKAGITIVVSPLEHLGAEPVLEALDGDFVVRSERGHKFDWIFRLYPVPSLLVEDVPRRERLRFRLELIR
jgi:hypothetical protein